MEHQSPKRPRPTREQHARYGVKSLMLAACTDRRRNTGQQLDAATSVVHVAVRISAACCSAITPLGNVFRGGGHRLPQYLPQ
jgi:hypothetical protein